MSNPPRKDSGGGDTRLGTSGPASDIATRVDSATGASHAVSSTAATHSPAPTASATSRTTSIDGASWSWCTRRPYSV